jgi:hypothetical protein
MERELAEKIFLGALRNDSVSSFNRADLEELAQAGFIAAGAFYKIATDSYNNAIRDAEDKFDRENAEKPNPKGPTDG